MRNPELGKVGEKIRQIRKSKKMNLQEVAQKSDITAGLLSRIENFKTLPSLPVLHKISIALEVPLSELVQTVGPSDNQTFSLITKGGARSEKDNLGWIHHYLLKTDFSDANIQIKKIKIPKGSYQTFNRVNGMELYYLEKGRLHFHMKGEQVKVNAGDTLYINPKTIIAVENVAPDPAIIFHISLAK